MTLFKMKYSKSNLSKIAVAIFLTLCLSYLRSSNSNTGQSTFETNDNHYGKNGIHNYPKPITQCQNGHVSDRLAYFDIFESINNIFLYEIEFLIRKVDKRKGRRDISARNPVNIPIVQDSWIKGNGIHVIINNEYMKNPGEFQAEFINATWTCEFLSSKNRHPEDFEETNPGGSERLFVSKPFTPTFVYVKGAPQSYIHIVCVFPYQSIESVIAVADLPSWLPFYFDLKAISTENKELVYYRNVMSCVIEKPHPPPSVTQNRLELCIMLNGDNIKYLIEWVAYHINLGIDHINIYVNEEPGQYVSVMKKFIEKDLVTIIDWNSLSTFRKHASVPTGFYDQLSQVGSCIHRAEGMTEFVGLWDVDEFIQVLPDDDDDEENPTNLPTLKQVIRSDVCGFHNKSIGSVAVSCQFFGCWNGSNYGSDGDDKYICNEPDDDSEQFFSFEDNSKVKGFSMLQNAVYRANTIVPLRKTKLIVRPEEIGTSSVHKILNHKHDGVITGACGTTLRLVHYKQARKGVFYLESTPNRMAKGYETEPIQMDSSMRMSLPSTMALVKKYTNQEFCNSKKRKKLCGLYAAKKSR